MGLADVTFVDALISERHSAGIELIILIRKNLCSGFVSEEKSHYISSVHRFFVITKKFVVPDNFVNDFLVTTWSLPINLRPRIKAFLIICW